MAFVSLDLAKRHLRVMHDDEDVEIAVYRDIAEEHVVAYLDRNVYALEAAIPSSDTHGITFNSAMRGAVLLIIGHLFENREEVTDVEQYEMPLASKRLLDRYRVWHPEYDAAYPNWRFPPDIAGTVGNPIGDIDFYDFVENGKAPYSFSAVSGLPDGVTLDTDGKLSGTPTAAVSRGIMEIRVSDSDGKCADIRLYVNIV